MEYVNLAWAFIKYYNLHLVVIILTATFAVTYSAKLGYRFYLFKTTPIGKRAYPNPYAIRIFSVLAGPIAGYMTWPDSSNIHWFAAGIIAGPVSICTHHALMRLSKNEYVKGKLPWLEGLIRGGK